MKPKKIVRSLTAEKVKPGEIEQVTDLKELNRLYALKIREELQEIISSDFKDILEFADLIQVAHQFALNNGFTKSQVIQAMMSKTIEKGMFNNLALNNLNPNNPSNKIYFDEVEKP